MSRTQHRRAEGKPGKWNCKLSTEALRDMFRKTSGRWPLYAIIGPWGHASKRMRIVFDDGFDFGLDGDCLVFKIEST